MNDRIIDLNTATPEELTSLPGIGQSMARRITEARPFTSLEDLRQISGVGPALLEQIEPLTRLSPPEPYRKARHRMSAR